MDVDPRDDGVPIAAATVPPWRITAASTTGVAHRRSGRGNDDAFSCASRHDGTLLLAVADGAGSADHAAVGARLAVNEALAALSATDAGAWPSRCAAAVSRVRRQLDSYARHHGSSLRDYACTLLLVEIDASAVHAGQIGDGAVVLRRQGTNLRLTEPGRGAHAGETVFVTGADALAQMSVGGAPLYGVEGIALLTDGLEPVALQGEAPFGPFFDPLFAFAAGAHRSADRSRLLATFLASERVSARSHDDLTLLLAVRP